jgi:hypothetical protein
MKKINFNVFFGLFLLLIGSLLILERFNINIRVDYTILAWIFLIIFGIFMIINDKKISIMPSIITFIGLWNLLNEIGLLTGSIFSLFWPIIIIIIGFNLVFAKKLFINLPPNIQKSGDVLTYSGIFSGVEERLTNKDFKGLVANAIFGGVELDLRDVEITQDIQIDVNAMFGGVTIILPEKYNLIKGESVALFGGVENKFKGKNEENKKTIYLNSRTIFGGIELR